MTERLNAEPNPEDQKILDLRILSLGHCETVDEMIGKIETVNKEEKVDTVLLQEFNFKVEGVLADLEKIKAIAQKDKLTIIIAPDNRYPSGRNLPWGTLKSEFSAREIIVEKTLVPNDYVPESVGIYLDKDGVVYAFPKSWHLTQVHNPVHRIPNTAIGVTICGEINHIKPENLDGISILYNPSMEGDDPDLKYRMLGAFTNSTRESIEAELKQEGSYEYLLESDDARRERDERSYQSLFEQSKANWGEEQATRFIEHLRESEKDHDSSVEARRKRFEEIVDELVKSSSGWKDSHYAKDIVDALKERNIPVVRTDAIRNSGVLNRLPNMEIRDLKYERDSARYRLVLKR